MIGKHRCSEKRHQNNYHNIKLCCGHSRSGWSNEQRLGSVVWGSFGSRLQRKCRCHVLLAIRLQNSLTLLGSFRKDFQTSPAFGGKNVTDCASKEGKLLFMICLPFFKKQTYLPPNYYQLLQPSSIKWTYRPLRKLIVISTCIFISMHLNKELC